MPSQPPRPPPRPQPTPASAVEFGEALRRLRGWAELTLAGMRDRSDRLPITTTSDYERGKAWPRHEWVAEFVVVCLRHRLPEATRAQLDAELAHWQRAWTYADRHRTTRPAAVPPEPTHRTAPPAAVPEGAVPVPETVATLIPPTSPPHTPATPPPQLRRGLARGEH